MPLVHLPAGVRMTPALLKQIMDQCGTCNPCGSGSGGSGSGDGSGGGSGSGSGSGSGDLSACCVCSSFPTTLTFTYDVPCIESDTVTLTRTVYRDNCRFEANPLGTVIIAYTYEFTGEYEEGSFTNIDCFTGASSLATEARKHVQIGLYCMVCDTNPEVHNWILLFILSKPVSSTSFRIVGYFNTIEVVSCTPLVFAEVNNTIICEDNRTIESCCKEFSVTVGCAIEPYTPWNDACLGSNMTLNASE